MTNAEQSREDLQNASHESRFVQEEDDGHITFMTVHDKTEGTMQSSSVSSDFTCKLLNLDNTGPDVNEIACLMNTSTFPPSPPPVNPSSHLTTTPQQQTPDSITTTINTTITLPKIPNFASLFWFEQRYLASKMKKAVDVAIRLQSNKLKEEAEAENQELFNQVDSTIKAIIKEQVKAQVSKIMPQIEKYVTESLGAKVLVRSTNQPQTSYAVAASLSEFKLKKILIDKMETNNLDIITSYGDVVTLKRGRDDQDKDEDPSAGSDRGTKRRKSSKDAKPLKGLKSKESKSSSSSKGNQSQPKSLGKSTQVEEPKFEAAYIEMKNDQGNESGHLDDQPDNKAAPKHDCTIAKARQPPRTFDELMFTPIDFSAYVMNRLKIDNLTQEILVGPPLPLIEDRGRQVVPTDYFINNDLEYLKGGSSSSKYVTSTTRTKAAKYDNIEGIEDMGPKRQRFYAYACHWKSPHDVYSKRRIIAVTSVKVMRWYDYGYLEEIVVRRDDNVLYKFKEGDFPRLNLCDIEDMLLLLVQKKLSNLDVDDRYDLGVALRMCVLHDIASNLEMDYLPKRHWSNLEMKRSRIMVKAIDKLLFERRLMRNLEKFVGGRDYGNDLRQLERTI
ncbi:hypothetical protein Tco_0659746 [Tanacetum coccineum]